MPKRSKFFSIICILLLIFNYTMMCCNAIEYGDDIVSPFWNNVSSNEIDIYTSNGKVWVEIELYGKSGTTYEGGILTLRRTIGSETVFLENLRNLSSSISTYNYYNDSHDATSGTYILKFAIYAVKNGVRERINLEKTLVI